MSSPKEISSTTFSPTLKVNDKFLDFWLQNVTIRLRREMCWKLHERSLLLDADAHNLQASKPLIDKGISDLSQVRYWQNKQKFYQTDISAKYLSSLLERKPPEVADNNVRGNMGWIVDRLDLDDASVLLLSLALACHLDAAVGNVISLCSSHPSKTQATLGLAQKLWDRPEEMLLLSDPGHILFRFGLLVMVNNFINTNVSNHYEIPLGVPPLIANHLIYPSSKLPSTLRPIIARDRHSSQDMGTISNVNYVASRIRSVSHEGLLVVPILGSGRSSRLRTMRDICRDTGKSIAEFVAAADMRLVENPIYLSSMLSLCWLRNIDLFIDLDLLTRRKSEDSEASPITLPLTSVPITVYLGISDTRDLLNVPKSLLTPVIEAHNLSYHERVQCWKRHLVSEGEGYENMILESSRRFRLDEAEIENVCNVLQGLGRSLSTQDFISSCWMEAGLDMGESAQKVNPRFTSEELILPMKQQVQFKELLNAMRSLTRVQYEWDMSHAWNEAGISALFAGPSGVGKTMAAEILSRELGLPMFRIDLSQIVNKFVGETEKNLKKLFDKAELCGDVLLFFDEAESLFGSRTELKDAHARYANLEVNYLLERMERYKGLAILATNRLKDIDDAFLRRLRCIIEFPLPGESQRKNIWRQCIPRSIDSSDIDIDFLAKQFQLTGGNIRSVVFNACLQSASSQDTKSGNKDKDKDKDKAKLTMESVIIATKREYDKLKQSLTLEQFGQYKNIIEKISRE